MKFRVDEDVCIGCGMCAATEPDVFEMNDNGVAQAHAEAEGAQIESAQSAMDGCPVGAISEE
ncbi:MAG: ferredoxin [Lachnospiraceae bacterium]|nr:ferredoxin [Lachnospiraceae bacterium]